METDAEKDLRDFAADIRSSDDDDPAARRRILDRVHREAAARPAGGRVVSREVECVAPRRGLTGLPAWWLRPRPVPVPPLGWAALALLLLVLSFGWFRQLPGGPGSGSGSLRRDAVAGARETEFIVVAPGASRVAVVGDFNDWDPQGTPLARSAGEGVWTAKLPLPAGVYSYNYVIDGRLQHAPDEPGLADEFGGGHSIVIVGEGSL